MKRLSNFWTLALFGLLLAGLLAACGDATSTSAPAAGSAAMNTTAAMAKPTDGAMMVQTPDAAMSKGGDAMAKPTDGAMMAQTTTAAMSKGGDAMSKTTPDAMAKPTDGAMMAKTTDAAMGKSGDAMTKAGPLTGSFNNQGAEPVAGKATIGKTTDGKLILRFENFKSANGPDLHVYLSKDTSPSTTTQVKNGIEIGKLKATEGSLNYELDASLDISQYKSVVIYCQSVSAIFGYANLQAGAA